MRFGTRKLYCLLLVISFVQIIHGEELADDDDDAEELESDLEEQDITSRDADAPEDLSPSAASGDDDDDKDSTAAKALSADDSSDTAAASSDDSKGKSDAPASAASGSDASELAALPAEIDPNLSLDILASKRSAVGTEESVKDNEILDESDKPEKKRQPQPQEDSDKEEATTLRTTTVKTTTKAPRREIIFSNSLKSNRVRRKFPLAFCTLERDNGVVCPGVRRGHFMEQFYFDEKSNRCMHFVYNGCGGNANRFSSLWECNSSCAKIKKSYILRK